MFKDVEWIVLQFASLPFRKPCLFDTKMVDIKAEADQGVFVCVG